MLPDLLAVALEFHRAPLRFAKLTDPARPLPSGFEGLLREMAEALLPANLSQVAERLQRPPEEIEAAARFFVRQVLLVPGADHYRVLGVSRKAAEDVIRQHYQLLVRLFHPDRIGADSDTGARETARLNAAYQALRDPVARQRYAKRLDAEGGGAKRPPPIRTVLRPEPSSGPLRRGKRGAGFRTAGVRRSLTAAAVLCGLAALSILVLLRPPAPSLRMDAERARQPPPAPAYLSGSRGPRAGVSAQDVGAGATDGAARGAPASAKEPVVLSSRGPATVASAGQAQLRPVLESAGPTETLEDLEPSPGRRPKIAVEAPASPSAAAAALTSTPVRASTAGKPASGPAAPRDDAPAGTPRANPDDLVARFVAAYERGDVEGFAALFAADARVNEGRGRGFIRSLYADFFRRVPRRRMKLESLQWQRAGEGKLLGEGRMWISVGKPRDIRRWRRGAGTIRFELIGTDEGYRIAGMFHQIESH